MNIRRFPPLDYHVNEALNTLCTNLSFADGNVKKIMITSCRPHEGKSFISMNLMRSLAQLGKKVVLVDFDIRASMLQSDYAIQVNVKENQKYLGITGYLTGKCGSDAILASTNIPGAYMILAGRSVTNSLPLLYTSRVETLLDELAAEFDVVLVDSAPVGTIIDAARVASVCDGTIFVIQSGAIRRQDLMECVRQIEHTGANILGYVINKFDEREFGEYGYMRSHYYDMYDGYGDRRRKKKKERIGW